MLSLFLDLVFSVCLLVRVKSEFLSVGFSLHRICSFRDMAISWEGGDVSKQTVPSLKVRLYYLKVEKELELMPYMCKERV